MAVIVKFKYVGPLLEAIAANPGASAAEIAAALNAPTKAGETVGTITADEARRQAGWEEAAKVQAEAVADAPKTATAQLAAQAWTDRLDEFDFSEGSDDLSLLSTLVNEGLLSAETQAKIISAATTDIPGASAAQTLGLGVCAAEFIDQVREYVGMEPEQVKQQLAALLLVRWLRQWAVPGADNKLVLPEYADVLALSEYVEFRKQIIQPYTEIAEVATVDGVLAEVLAMLKGSES